MPHSLDRGAGMKNQMTRVLCMMVLAGLPAPLMAKQASQTKPKINDAPLTEEQVAVYRTVLKDWSKGTDTPLNLADTTDSLEHFGLSFDANCGKEFDVKNADQGVHRLDARVAVTPKMVLVDPERQAEIIKRNDPQNLIKRGLDDHENVTDKQLDRSVTEAFNSGLFTLSEIIFDKQHRHVLVAYSFWCGMLCGHGNTLILDKVGKKWKVSKRCGGWVS
jgi:hypothetical protein